jgi:hypothetical protein
MAGRSRVAASALLGVVTCLGSPVAAQVQRAADVYLPVVTRVAILAPGEPGAITGVVRNEQGDPILGAVVSALGATTSFAVTDALGRYEITTLNPGPYLLRAHSRGYIAPRAQMIEIHSNVRLASSFDLKRAEGQPTVLAAGIGSLPASSEPDPSDREAAGAAATAPSPAPTRDPDDHSETAWRLRHARRGVLKDRLLPADFTGDDDGVEAAAGDFLGGTVNSPARAATSFFADTVFSGQVNFLTTSAFDTPEELLTGNNLARGIAYLSVGAPVGEHADWTVRGAITDADIASWNVAGSYKTREALRHRYDVGMSYSAQRYAGGNPLALRDVRDGSRNAGTVYGFDTFALSPSLAVTYGARYAHYDYLEQRNLISPRLAITLSPTANFHLGASVSSRGDAPGAEEFLPPNDSGLWLPPQRTFSSIEPGHGMRAERTTQMAVELARDFGATTISIRGFRQLIDDQLVTVFGAENPEYPGSKLGHYVVGNAGGAEAAGARVTLRTALAGRVHGSIAYTAARSQVMPGSDLGYVVFVAPAGGAALPERLHDVTTSIETEVPETATRVVILYRVGNGYAGPAGAAERQAGVDSRFDFQIRQALPFLNFTNARWEMLIAIRNFFREAESDQSIYDELLAVRPPKRIVGGVTLRF